MSGCLLLAPLAEGRALTTVEGLGGDDPVQRAFAEAHAFQCGYCTPGMILAAKRLLEENPAPSADEVRLALAGNLCRCGCYVKIVEAVLAAAGEEEG
jgi:aerobic-type carbon monoxide dehydrogenase small subunit (CoxS/CutS family)